MFADELRRMGTRLWLAVFALTACARGSLALEEARRAATAGEAEGRSVAAETTALLATTERWYRQPRWHRHDREGFVAADTRSTHDEYQDEAVDPQDHDHADAKAVGPTKTEYWGGYYDFLINEGSYKFWAVFQLATAALLIYSGFAALYYAKVNPQFTDDYDDILFRRRRRRSIERDKLPRDRPFSGMEPLSLQLILDAIADEIR